jgi:integrase
LIHVLRHSSGTLAVQVSTQRLKVHMGHTDMATTMIYVHHVSQIDAAKKPSTALKEISAPSLAMTGSSG